MVWMGVLLCGAACDGGRDVPAPSGPVPRSDAAVLPDVGPFDAVGAPSPDGGEASDGGGCAVGPVQAVGQACCLALGADACTLGASCAALDGRTVPLCYADGSRRAGESCTQAAQCAQGACSGGTCGDVERFTTAAAIEAYFVDTELLAEGSDIPSHPFGLSESVNYGQATQCLSSLRWTTPGGVVNHRITHGTLVGAPAPGSVGTCRRDQPSVELMMQSQSFAIAHVQGNGRCFDVDVVFSGFAVEGRGRLAPDGQQVELELYFGGQATGMRCADGEVRAASVRLMGAAFTGDATVVYRRQP